MNKRIKEITDMKTIINCYLKLDWWNFDEAVTRMNIAYVMNGGSYIGFYETAIQYLKSLERGSSNVTNN